MSEASTGFAAAQEAIWHRVRPELARRVATLEDAVLALLEGRLQEPERASAEREAHKLAGTFGTFGYHHESEIAAQLEALLGRPERALPAARLRAAALVEQLDAPLHRDSPADPDPGSPTRLVIVVAADAATAVAVVAAAEPRGLLTEVVPSLESAADVLGRRRADAVLLFAAGPGVSTDELAGLSRLAGAEPSCLLVLAASDLDTRQRLLVADAGVRLVASREAPAARLVDAVAAGLGAMQVPSAKVLVVDDDPVVLEAIRAVLEPTELQPVTLTDPLRLWDVMAAQEPDLVLLDVDMPGVDGLALCRLLRSDDRWRSVPVVFLSGLAADRVEETYAAGADDFVAKPVRGVVLLQRLRARLDRVRLHRRLAETDPMTGLANLRALQREWSRRASRACAGHNSDAGPASLALLDIDHLRRVNETHGHGAGDQIIQRVAGALRATARPSEVVARIGAGEFGLLLDDPPIGAATRLRAGLRALRESAGIPLASGATVTVSVSGGVAPTTTEDRFADLWRVADSAVMRAKAAGGNHVVVADSAGSVRGSSPTSVDVVVVEDDEVVVELLRHAVASAGLTCHIVTDGQQAVDLLTGTPPTVIARAVLLDVDLPSRSGIEVLRALRRAGVLHETRVTMVTGRSTEHDVAQSLAEGAVDHIAKPLSIPVLVHKLRRTLGGVP